MALPTILGLWCLGEFKSPRVGRFWRAQEFGRMVPPSDGSIVPCWVPSVDLAGADEVTERSLGVRVKIARANRHAEELGREVKEYLGSQPFQVVQEEEPCSGDLLARVRVLRAPSPELGAIVGDVVHNLRAALDQLAWQLVLSNGHVPSSRTQFPVGDSRRKFEKDVDFRLPNAGRTAVEMVKQLKVFPDGDHVLWRLHRLDIEDKHRLLIPVGMSHAAVNMHTTFKGFKPGDEPTTLEPLAILPADRQYPLLDGAVVFRIAKGAQENAEEGSSPIHTDFSFTFELGFGDESLVGGEPVIPAIPNLVSHVAEVTAPLIALVDRP